MNRRTRESSRGSMEQAWQLAERRRLELAHEFVGEQFPNTAPDAMVALSLGAYLEADKRAAVLEEEAKELMTAARKPLEAAVAVAFSQPVRVIHGKFFGFKHSKNPIEHWRYGPGQLKMLEVEDQVLQLQARVRGEEEVSHFIGESWQLIDWVDLEAEIDGYSCRARSLEWEPIEASTDN